MIIVERIAKLSVNKCVIFMTLSVAILSILIPIIQSKLSRNEFNVLESQEQLNQSEIRNAQALYHANFANYLLTKKDFEVNEKLKELWKLNMEEAAKNLRYRLMLLHTAITDKLPNEAIFNKWKSMSFEQLDEEVGKAEFLNQDWKTNAKKTISLLILLRNILYAIALLLYGIGMLGLNLKKSSK